MTFNVLHRFCGMGVFQNAEQEHRISSDGFAPPRSRLGAMNDRSSSVMVSRILSAHERGWPRPCSLEAGSSDPVGLSLCPPEGSVGWVGNAMK